MSIRILHKHILCSATHYFACKCPIVCNALRHFFLSEFCFFMYLFNEMSAGMANNVDPDQIDT